VSQLDLNLTRWKTSEKKGKIIIAGLAGSGKTSIYKIIFEHADPKTLETTPTQNYSLLVPLVKFLGPKKLVVIDLGGQKRFLEQSLKQPSSFYQDTIALIYVIDIQNTKQFDTDLRFFQDILRTVTNVTRNNLPIFVFYHKMDPSIDEGVEKARDEYIQNLSHQINEYASIICSSCVIREYRTSIYDLESLSTAMIDVLSYSLLDELFRRLVGSIFLEESHLTILANFDKLKAEDPSNIQSLKNFATSIGSKISLMFREELAKLQLNPSPTPVEPITPTADTTSSPAYVPAETERSLIPLIHELPTNDLEIEFTCPMINPDDPQSRENINLRCCEITHGLLEGVTQTMGYQNVDMLQTMVLHYTPTCKFRANKIKQTD
jgi:GTPase SAR1 family protein